MLRSALPHSAVNQGVLFKRAVFPAFFRRLFIKVEPTPNPDSLKFQPEKRLILHERFGVGLHFDRSSSPPTAASNLAKQLLKKSAVTSVYFGRDFVSVNKTEDTSWAVSARALLKGICVGHGGLPFPGAQARCPLCPHGCAGGAERIYCRPGRGR